MPSSLKASNWQTEMSLENLKLLVFLASGQLAARIYGEQASDLNSEIFGQS